MLLAVRIAVSAGVACCLFHHSSRLVGQPPGVDKRILHPAWRKAAILAPFHGDMSPLSAACLCRLLFMPCRRCTATNPVSRSAILTLLRFLPRDKNGVAGPACRLLWACPASTSVPGSPSRAVASPKPCPWVRSRRLAPHDERQNNKETFMSGPTATVSRLALGYRGCRPSPRPPRGCIPSLFPTAPSASGR